MSLESASLVSERVAIEAVLDAVRDGLRDRDANAVGAQFAAGATVFDLAPPLAHPFSVQELATWIDGWDGPIGQEWRDLAITIDGDLAVCHGLVKMTATVRDGGDQARWWQRSTICLRWQDGRWRIVHEHSSVPFHMDGSFRAAIDLQP